MTELGLCHNATFPESRLTPAHIQRLRPRWARTITYWRGTDDLSSWQATVDSCREIAAMGVKNLVVFNTEAYGGVVNDVHLMERRLRQFLELAGGSVHAIEPGNELDMPGWTDNGLSPEQGGRPISNELIAEIGVRAADVCQQFGVICLSPSLLTGPGEGRFEAIARALQGSKIGAMAVHPYGRSVGGQPEPGWIHGTVEAASDECRDLGTGYHTWFTEVGCWTKAGTRGFVGQREFIEELKRFEHEFIDVVFYFTAFDAAVPEGEMVEGKDWGLIDLGGGLKPSCLVFDGELEVRAPPPVTRPPVTRPPFRYVAGFKKMQEVNPGLIGDPAENEFPLTEGWSTQRTTRGRLLWSDLKAGPKFLFLHRDGRRFLWSEEESWASLRPLPPQPPVPGARFVLGFEKLHALDPGLIGDAVENESQLTDGWNGQRTANGELFWCDLKAGARHGFFHRDGRCYLWSEEENWPLPREVKDVRLSSSPAGRGAPRGSAEPQQR